MFTVLAVWGPVLLVQSQVIPLFQDVFQGYLKLPGQNGILVVHLESRTNRRPGVLGLLARGTHWAHCRAGLARFQVSGTNTT